MKHRPRAGTGASGAFGPDIDYLPDDGWTFIGENGREAEFVTVGGNLGMSVGLTNEGGWKVASWFDWQDAWLRASRADAAGVENLEGWLTTIVARAVGQSDAHGGTAGPCLAGSLRKGRRSEYDLTLAEIHHLGSWNLLRTLCA